MILSNRLQKHVDLQIDVAFQDVKKQIKTSRNSSEIFRIAQSVLKKTLGIWHPAAIFRWYEFEIISQEGICRLFTNTKESIHLNLGSSTKFLKHARYVMVSAYTIGGNLDAKSSYASSIGHMLEAYLIDMIGLTALEKTGDFIKQTAEDQARSMGWGVSHFVTPGLVNGWDLGELSKLCSLLPIEDINMAIENNMVLFPLKSICALIGIGPGYKSYRVGHTCKVCSKRECCHLSIN